MPARSIVVPALIGAALGGTVACATRAPSPAASPQVARAPVSPDSLEGVCERGDTTTLLLRSRRSGRQHVERWLFTPRGTVIDLTTGAQIMDSAQASSTGIRDLLRQQQALDARAAELSRAAGEPVPVSAACRVSP